VVTPEEIAFFAPILVAIGGVILYLCIKFLPRTFRSLGGVLAAGWLFVVFCLMLAVIIPHPSFTDFPFIGLTGGLLITGIGAIAAWASQGSIDPKGPVHLYYPLFLFALAGAVAIGFSADLFTIFVMVELSAIPVYALCAYRHREDPAALGSALQYLVQGVSGTLTALLGVAILFMAGHTLNLHELPKALAGADPALIMVSGVLILVGYGVKLAIVPMHTWLPNAYAHAPAGVTAIMVGATKIGVLIAMFLSLSALPGNVAVPANLGIIIIFFAVLTMTAGNLLALNQPDLRYILGYSSVAQMGYILLGFGIGMVYNLELGFIAGLYYAIAYSLMKAGAFLAVDAFASCAGSFETAKMNGQGARHPLLGMSMVIFIFGLSGVPFTCGFLGKLLLEQAGMVTSMISGVILALVLALNSAISLGYYVPVMSTLIFPDKKNQTDKMPENIKKIPITHISGIVILAIITVYFGLFPESFEWISHAGGQLYTWGVR
jgi:NADH:ubiquinone oxidoreductase subunit 2 (subunit N)